MKEIIIVDIETSGFQHQGGLIVEVGIVSLDLQYEDVVRANNLLKAIPEIQSIFDKHPCGATAFNKRFDFGFLKSRGLRIKELPCIMLSAAPAVDLPPNPGYRDPKWPKVQEAWDFFFPRSNYIEAHRALDDARHEALIAYELYKLGKFSV